jgi:hypothetical protein
MKLSEVILSVPRYPGISKSVRQTLTTLKGYSHVILSVSRYSAISKSVQKTLTTLKGHSQEKVKK